MMTKIAVLLVVLVGCNPAKESSQPKKSGSTGPQLGDVVQRGTMKRAQIVVEYGIALGEGADVKALEQLARTKTSHVQVTTADAYLGGGLLDIVTRRLEASELDRFKKSPALISIRREGTDGLEVTRELASAAREIAEASQGWVVDGELVRLYSAADFVKHIPGTHLDVRELISVHAIIGGNEQPFLATAGLRRYGLTDLYIREVGAGQVEAVMKLMNAAAQVLINGGDVDANGKLSIDFRQLGWAEDILEGGTGKAAFATRWSRERDAHPDDEPVVELIAPRGADPAAWASILDECLGSEPEQIARIGADDPELLEAGKRARRELAASRAHFKDGIPFDERLTIKASFTDANGDVEWMWVDVVAFKGDLFTGTLANEPERVPSLRLGQKVNVKLADVSDYLHSRPGEKPIGGYSIEVFRKRGLIK
jgi:uncharacterized protein YegJ (DUF2314 family)